MHGVMLGLRIAVGNPGGKLGTRSGADAGASRCRWQNNARSRGADLSNSKNFAWSGTPIPVPATNNIGMRALVKLVTSWVKVPPIELDGSRSKRGIREEAVKPNHKWRKHGCTSGLWSTYTDEDFHERFQLYRMPSAAERKRNR